ncbi:hypothetical protein MBLNU459_g0756t1 [Dothideomycetes sp. NU459]
MGVDAKRPPLPAPTEEPSSMDNDSLLGTDVATNISRRTDATSLSIPEDGSPITISTQKLTGSKEGLLHHGRHKSQTSLLIEYFEAGKNGDKTRARPSVRVKVTPSAARRSKMTSDAVQITGIGKDRKPSYTRRISLGNKNTESHHIAAEGTEISHSSESNLSGRPPVEVEILNHGSDLSNSRTSRDLRYLHNPSDISSMPPDSLLDGSEVSERPQERRSSDHDDVVVATDHLSAPARERERSASRERITQKIVEKLTGKQRESSGKHRHHREGIEYEPETKPSKERRRRSSKSHREEEIVSGAESSFVSSSMAPSQTTSYRSGATSKVSLNNPRLLEMVEDTVKRLILPEINQLKHEQRTDRHQRDVEDDDDDRRESYTDSYRDSYGEDSTRRVSKSSSSPNMSSKPKVVLNRYDDDPGEVLSRGDSERRTDSDRRKTRKSSRESVPVSERSHGDRDRDRRSSRSETIEEERVHRKKSKDKDGHRLRDAAAAGVAGGILTAAALRHHDSGESVNREKRKKRTKSRSSRSRSTSVAETTEEYRKEDIPPMPWSGPGAFNDSELTRDSILSAATERPLPPSGSNTPIREVSRGAVAEAISPSSRTPTRTPATLRGIGSFHSNHSLADSASQSPQGTHSISTKARIAALAAAGLGGAALHEKLTKEHKTNVVDEYGSPRSQRHLSPVQSVTSLKNSHDDPLIPQGLRPRSRASQLTEHERRHSNTSLHSVSANGSLAGVEAMNAVDQHLHSGRDAGYDEQGIQREDMDEWYQKQHEENERYRHSMAESGVTDSLDGRRMTQYTEDSYDTNDPTLSGKDVRHVAGVPEYVHTPHAVESAVASLLEPSMISSIRSSDGSTSRVEDTRYHDRMAESMREVSRESPAPHEISAIGAAQDSPSKSRWSMLRDHAQALSAHGSDPSAANSPRHSEARSPRDDRSFRDHTPVQLGASGVPLVDDPMPEIGHGLDEESEFSTNTADVRGSGIKAKENRWSYDSTPPPSRGKEVHERDSFSQNSTKLGKPGLLGAGVAGAAAGALAAEHLRSREKSPALSPGQHNLEPLSPGLSVDHGYSRESTPALQQAEAVYMDRASATPTSPVHYGDEGYASAAYARSGGAATPKGNNYKEDKQYSKQEIAEYEAAMGADDPFVGDRTKHSRHLSANSHGMASPLYDSATGKGIDRIQSKDVVALMDHLTVRDAQRNARDTEILVTLVRTAAEMRNNFEDIKKFIAEQDKMIMDNTDRDADYTVKKVLGGPRPQPQSTPRSPRVGYEEEDLPTKRKNIFKRALKGLSSRSSNDLGNIEEMLNKLLGDVEILKETQTGTRPSMSLRTDSLDSYDRLRNAPDSGYEPDGQAGTSSTPNRSGNLSLTPTRENKHFHSGYDGRRDSVNRVSTVMEGDEEDSLLDPHEAAVLNNQFEGNERLLTPTQETFRRGAGPAHKSPRQEQGAFNVTRSAENTPMTDKQRKHNSNSSSLMGKINSRWSKSTTTSVPDHSYEEYGKRKSLQSQASRSGESLGDDGYYDNGYAVQSDDRLRSTQSLAREEAEGRTDNRSLRSDLDRTPSPLIPSETSSVRNMPTHTAAPTHLYADRDLGGDYDDDDEESLEDPKYKAHRNSVLLQHPQPRPGPTHRHQTNLENEARTFSGDLEGGLTDSDLSQRTAESDFDPLQWGSNPSLSLARTNKLSSLNKDQSPLVPSQQPARAAGVEQPREERRQQPQQQQPRHAYDRMYYSSPLGSGHLLEPIEEVRYSLETDRGSRSPAPNAVPSSAIPRSAARKITGPRPMAGASGRSPSAAKEEPAERSGTVRRKPVAGSSLKSYDSFDSETF